MTSELLIRDESGAKRRVEPSAFPLAVGGSEADIAVADLETPEPLAYLGMSEGELFVQTATGRVTCNGTPVTTSQWLRDGDVLSVGPLRLELERVNGGLQLRVGRSKTANTEPPVLKPAARSSEEDPKAGPGGGIAVTAAEFAPKSLSEANRRPLRIRPATVAFWLSTLLLVAAGWFLFNLRVVTLEVDPAADRVGLDGGWFVAEIGGGFWVHPGSYTAVAEKEGYRRLERTLEVGGDRRPTFHLALEKLPGRLALTTSPAEGATVLIDGVEVGTTPLEPVELTPGEHHVLVKADGYRDFQSEVVIEGEGTLASLDATLEPRWAQVTFQSQPPGASVRIGGRSHGPTPVKVAVIEGTHDYQILLKGHKTFQSRVHVVAGEPQRLSPVTLDLVDGTISVTSTPSQANVTLDGVYQGQTPLEVYLSPEETHELTLSRAGYASLKREVTVRPGATDELELTLDAQLGQVELIVDPPDAELFVNGESRGAAQQVLNLPATSHQLEIKKDGYESFATNITPRPGFPQNIEVELRTIEAAKRAARLDVITTSQGQELRLIDPLTIEMGASRREPGRRANETERTVALTRPYYLATTEVTNRQFREFREGHRSGGLKGYNLEVDHHPVVRVTWQDAAAYCNWLSGKESLLPAYVNAGGKLVPVEPPTTGYRLPTEAEWTRAARYPAGVQLKYPWGDTLPVTAGAGNYADSTAKGLVTTVIPNYNDAFATTAPVDSFEKNALGLYNLGGNVSEWMHDFYTIYPAGGGESNDPTGPKEGEFHVIRGASWMQGSVTQLRLSFRDYGNKARPDVGFRIARYTE